MVGQESKEKPIRTRFLCTFTNCQGDEKWNDDDDNDDDNKTTLMMTVVMMIELVLLGWGA